MRRALGVVAIAVVAVVLPACGGGDRSGLDAAQCKLLSASDVGGAVAAESPAGVLLAHEEDGDGTWCLFDMAAGRLETRFQPGSQSDFDARRAACLRDGGGPSRDVAASAGPMIFCPYGLAAAVGFKNGFLIIVHDLNGNSEQLTTAVANVAMSRCCPTA